MTKHISFLVPFLLAFVVQACGDGSSPEEAATTTKLGIGQTCQFEGVATTELGQPLSGLRVVGRSMVQVDERRWAGATEETVQLGEDGAFSFAVPCGSSLALDFPEWSWPVEPDHLIVKPDQEPLTIRLVPKRMVMLRLESSPGRRLEGTIVRVGSPGVQAEALPVPLGGIQLEAVSWAAVEGEIQADGYPSRSWALNRSHELHEVAPDRFEAVMVMGPAAPAWLEVAPELLRQIQGVSCVSGEVRGASCKRMRAAWFCACEGAPTLAINSERWDTAIVRDVAEGGVELSELPSGVKQCFSGTPASRYHITPPGLRPDPLVGVELKLSTDPTCVVLPEGEKHEIRDPDWSGVFIARDEPLSLPF